MAGWLDLRSGTPGVDLGLARVRDHVRVVACDEACKAFKDETGEQREGWGRPHYAGRYTKSSSQPKPVLDLSSR